MNQGQARFTLRYVFANPDFIQAIITESDLSVTVRFANGIKMPLSAAAETLGAETPLIVSMLRLIAPLAQVIEPRIPFTRPAAPAPPDQPSEAPSLYLASA
jgi:hypothetical protein